MGLIKHIGRTNLPPNALFQTEIFYKAYGEPSARWHVVRDRVSLAYAVSSVTYYNRHSVDPATTMRISPSATQHAARQP
jgi:hypothetical protein